MPPDPTQMLPRFACHLQDNKKLCLIAIVVIKIMIIVRINKSNCFQECLEKILLITDYRLSVRILLIVFKYVAGSIYDHCVKTMCVIILSLRFTIPVDFSPTLSVCDASWVQKLLYSPRRWMILKF